MILAYEHNIENITACDRQVDLLFITGNVIHGKIILEFHVQLFLDILGVQYSLAYLPQAGYARSSNRNCDGSVVLC